MCPQASCCGADYLVRHFYNYCGKNLWLFGKKNPQNIQLFMESSEIHTKYLSMALLEIYEASSLSQRLYPEQRRH